MRELETASGISRETIRYYIREGLLPQPDRTHRNSATYSAEHLDRLHAIRRLKDERFLPLSVIRELLNGEKPGSLETESLPQLDQLLHNRLDQENARVDAAQYLAELGGSPENLADCIASGVITPDAKGQIGIQDQRILRLLLQAGKIGFTSERGYMHRHMGRVPAVMQSLAEMEMKDFFANVAPHVGELEAVDMAEQGIGILTQLMSEFFTREILALLRERRAQASQPPA